MVRVRAWYGTAGDLGRLFDTVERLYDDDREAARRALPRPSPIYPVFQREAFARDWTSTLSVTDGQGRRRIGAREEVLTDVTTAAGLTDNAAHDVEYAYPRYIPGVGSVSLRFSADDGLRIFLRADDAARVRRIGDAVTDAAQHNRPAWSWFSATWGGAIAVYAVLAALFGGLGLLLSSRSHPWFRHAWLHAAWLHGAALPIARGIFVAVALLVLVLVVRARRAAPRFELTDDTPQALRALRVVVVLAVLLAAAIVAVYATT